jgi:hypothetical protein
LWQCNTFTQLDQTDFGKARSSQIDPTINLALGSRSRPIRIKIKTYRQRQASCDLEGRPETGDMDGQTDNGNQSMKAGRQSERTERKEKKRKESDRSKG